MTDRRKEIERLVSEYGAESYAGALPGREYAAHGALMAAIDSLFAALEESERDARRYRWVRQCPTMTGEKPPEKLDAAIDAVIAQEPKP